MNQTVTPFILSVLFVRLASLVVVALYLPSTLSEIALTIAFENQAGGPPSTIMNYVRWFATPALVALLASLAFFKATRLARLLTRGLHPPGHCQRCGYNIAATNQSRCPECGHDDQSKPPQ
jgi:predicted Zn-ribbon and HTH transcriptional regulator